MVIINSESLYSPSNVVKLYIEWWTEKNHER